MTGPESLIRVVDDFFDDPQHLREEALRLAYAEPPSQVQREARGPIARYAEVPAATRESFVNRLQPYLPAALDHITLEYRYVHAGTIKKQVCHADGCDIAGVVHLTLPEQCQGGTWFFRHRPTGHVYCDRAVPIARDYQDDAQWQRYHEAPMRFNRLAFYPGEMFHAIATPYFGDRAENGRLALTFFARLREPLRVLSSGEHQELTIGVERHRLHI